MNRIEDEAKAIEREINRIVLAPNAEIIAWAKAHGHLRQGGASSSRRW